MPNKILIRLLGAAVVLMRVPVAVRAADAGVDPGSAGSPSMPPTPASTLARRRRRRPRS